MKIVKVSTSFLSDDSDPELIADCGVIMTAMDKNPYYVTPTPGLDVLGAVVLTFTNAYNNGGGPEATALKDEARAALVPLFRSLGAYVQANCKNTLSILLSSGFPAQKTERQPVGPLPAPPYCTLSLNGNTGELDVSVPPQDNVSIYNWNLMTADNPTVVVKAAQSTPSSYTFTGLKPGTTYIAQANVVGTAGTSNWTQSSSQMAV
jgi:hypothetical protein